MISSVALLEKLASAPTSRSISTVPLEHNGQGIVISNVDHAHYYFLPLFVTLQLNGKIHQKNMADFIIPPYDLYCPSVLPHLSKRCCSVCGIYNASVKSALSAWVTRTKACHPKTVPPAVITKIQSAENGRPIRRCRTSTGKDASLETT